MSRSDESPSVPPLVKIRGPNPTFHMRRPLRLAFLDRAVWCDECWDGIPPGVPVTVFPPDGSGPSRIIHADGCPRAWAPGVIKGGGRPTPPTLTYLAIVPDPHESESP
jgi:hypothetical protein